MSVVTQSERSKVYDGYLSFADGFPELPKKRFVGLLACQCNPTLRTLDTTVIRCEPNNIKKLAKAADKKQQAALVADASPWLIELEDTVLFPEGGGQPSDEGRLSALDGDKIIVNVAQVQRHGLDAVHYVDKPLAVGQRVRVDVDWDRRTDLMDQHTGQHLLSAVLEHEVKLDTLSWSLCPRPQLSYIELPRIPTPQEIEYALKRCNDLIASNSKIRVSIALNDDTSGTRPDSLPKDYRGGVIRTVIIEDLDENPCCGTHYTSLAALGSLYLSPHTTSVRGTNARLYFCAGNRVREQLSGALEHQRDLTRLLYCQPEQLVERVQQQMTTAKDALKHARSLREELLPFLSHQIVSSAKKAENGNTYALFVRYASSTNDNEFLADLTRDLQKGSQANATPSLVALAVCDSAQWNTNGGCLVLFGEKAAHVEAAAKAIKAEPSFTTRVRGGGKGRYQGKLSSATDAWSDSDAALLERILAEAVVST
ncbi:hypothetical protein E5Q_01726 [Mixia osmundae IAM 14324]|uniref:Alanyl-tRNA synthetase class IIc N-terminal domain-containing protein n=2 Tax=Mixia osmundae (strain CBS 9802 / IAM 14324 / JCM 22182 / KY 12970) TaxID=764103 RepID=G7DWX4_MIXOS|nr:hypothetical protein E5Q_01726 [Mixia osmundae IAM 14324]